MSRRASAIGMDEGIGVDLLPGKILGSRSMLGIWLRAGQPGIKSSLMECLAQTRRDPAAGGVAGVGGGGGEDSGGPISMGERTSCRKFCLVLVVLGRTRDHGLARRRISGSALQNGGGDLDRGGPTPSCGKKNQSGRGRLIEDLNGPPPQRPCTFAAAPWRDKRRFWARGPL